MFLHPNRLTREHKAIRIIDELDLSIAEWNIITGPCMTSIDGVIECIPAEDPGPCCCLEENATEGSDTRHGNVVPGDAAVIGTQNGSIANCPAVECIDHVQTANNGRKDNGSWHNDRRICRCHCGRHLAGYI